jgi:hypothetical protein
MDNYTIEYIDLTPVNIGDFVQEFIYEQVPTVTPIFKDTLVVSTIIAQTVLYTHTQTTPATVWIINHNLGLKPAVQLLSVGGVEFIGEIVHSSVNQTIIYLTSAYAGIAQLRG